MTTVDKIVVEKEVHSAKELGYITEEEVKELSEYFPDYQKIEEELREKVGVDKWIEVCSCADDLEDIEVDKVFEDKKINHVLNELGEENVNE